ncbi:MAG: DUF805 domain-containing protein [Burkholderiaceae bacterium]|nr:DUF805 domain-containing protein [Burkholderiaceae bacterium]
MKWILIVLEKYAVFEGRSRRKEYWMFALMAILFWFMLNIVFHTLESIFRMSDTAGNIGHILYNLGLFIPAVAVGVRRLHDSGRNGWWLLFPFVNIVLLCLPTQPGENQYGPAPSLED